MRTPTKSRSGGVNQVRRIWLFPGSAIKLLISKGGVVSVGDGSVVVVVVVAWVVVVGGLVVVVVVGAVEDVVGSRVVVVEGPVVVGLG